jgi:hypothetical protein
MSLPLVLQRLQAFLPELARANEALAAGHTTADPEVVDAEDDEDDEDDEDADDRSSSGSRSGEDDTEEPTLRVNMVRAKSRGGQVCTLKGRRV